MAQHLLSQEFLSRLDNLRLASNQPVRGHLRGMHRSRRTGAGMEFVDFRPYSQGDDLKSVDWRTYLRLDRLIVKLFLEETDLPIHIFLDTSASMGFGQPSKLDFGRKVAAAVAHIGLINMDRVSLVAVAAGVVKEMSGLRGKSQNWAAFDFLQRLSAEGATALATAFKQYFAAPRARGLVVVISDFLDAAGFEPALAILRHVGHDVLVLHLTSNDDLLSLSGREMILVDVEDGSAVQHSVTPALLAAYDREFLQHCARLKGY
jgi:uncharacterized protein (DUF58 family)